MHYCSNVLVSKGYSINKEFQDYTNILREENEEANNNNNNNVND